MSVQRSSSISYYFNHAIGFLKGMVVVDYFHKIDGVTDLAELDAECGFGERG